MWKWTCLWPNWKRISWIPPSMVTPCFMTEKGMIQELHPKMSEFLPCTKHSRSLVKTFSTHYKMCASIWCLIWTEKMRTCVPELEVLFLCRIISGNIWCFDWQESGASREGDNNQYCLSWLSSEMITDGMSLLFLNRPPPFIGGKC